MKRRFAGARAASVSSKAQIRTEGQAFQLAYRMDLEGGQGGGPGQRSTDLDFGSTGTLTFDLPAGHTITSDLGYTGADPAPVPSAPWWPLAAALVGAALLALRAGSLRRT